MIYLNVEDFPKLLTTTIINILKCYGKVSFSFMIRELKETGWKNVSRLRPPNFEHNGFGVEEIYKDNGFGKKIILTKTYIYFK